MNPRAPDEPAVPRSEGAVLRFLRWLIEPPVESQPGGWRVLRWLLRALAFVFYAILAGESPETGNAGVARSDGKHAEPTAGGSGIRRVDRDQS